MSARSISKEIISIFNEFPRDNRVIIAGVGAIALGVCIESAHSWLSERSSYRAAKRLRVEKAAGQTPVLSQSQDDLIKMRAGLEASGSLDVDGSDAFEVLESR